MSAGQLPPLPVPEIARSTYPDLFTSDQMREYGKASRKATLEYAAKYFDRRAGGHGSIGVEIRNLK